MDFILSSFFSPFVTLKAGAWSASSVAGSVEAKDNHQK
jgi:hypothetical protein